MAGVNSPPHPQRTAYEQSSVHLFFPSNSPFTICHGKGSVSVLQDFLGSEKKKEVALLLKTFSTSVQSVNLSHKR